MATKKQTTADAELVQEVMEGYGNDKKSHDAFLAKVDQRYSAYRAILEIKSTAAQWQSKQHPPYVFQIIETMAANLLDPNPSWRVRPRPRMADEHEREQLREGARANEILLNQQADVDKLGEKQVVFVKQALITGLSAYKTFWNYGEQRVRRQVNVGQEVSPGVMLPKLGTRDTVTVVHDDPTVEVVDVRDFIWHEAAISLDKASRVTHRVLYTMDELKRLERAGIYRNVSELVESRVTDPGVFKREQDLFEVDRAKDMVEVLEQWRRTDGGIKVTTVGNGNVLLADRDNPFWHGQFPFIVCSSVPDLFRIPGVSEAELICELQEIAWTLLNQRLDSLSFLLNSVILMADDVEDYDSFEWAPGAVNLVPRPVTETVKIMEMTDAPARVSLEAEQLIKQDLQNIPGASPTLLGQIDQSSNTATEVSLTTSLGQRRIAAKKQQFRYCHGRLGEQWMRLNQQFVRDARLVAVVGRGGAEAFHQVEPLLIQGDYYIDLEALDESLLLQERKAQAQATLQVALAAAPVFAALSQAGISPMLNMPAFMNDLLESAGISDTERYYVSQPAPQLGQQGGSGNGAAAAAQQLPANGKGATAPQAINLQAPSNPYSNSPVASIQRLLAMSGGPVNAQT